MTAVAGEAGATELRLDSGDLRRAELGDDLFWRALRAYTGAFMGKSVATAEFQQAMEHASGVDLTAFVRRWIYSTGGGV
jgi:aminopeptidase N